MLGLTGCASMIVAAGAFGGLTSSLINPDGVTFPRRQEGGVCLGSIGNIIVGAFAAFASWALYGAGAGIDLAKANVWQVNQGTLAANANLSLTFSALGCAFLVGVAGARWITGEVDQQLLKNSVAIAAASDPLSPTEAVKLAQGAPREVLNSVKKRCTSAESPDTNKKSVAAVAR